MNPLQDCEYPPIFGAAKISRRPRLQAVDWGRLKGADEGTLTIASC
jgi:hypothetical protein